MRQHIELNGNNCYMTEHCVACGNPFKALDTIASGFEDDRFIGHLCASCVHGADIPIKVGTWRDEDHTLDELTAGLTTSLGAQERTIR
jgi:hypothetical protein